MSIYEYICDHLTPSGTLPADFKLPGRTPAEASSSHSALSDMQLVDGALDGIALFHGPSEEADCTPLADLMSSTSMGDTESIQVAIEAYFAPSTGHRMLPLEAPLLQWTSDHTDEVNADGLFALAANLLVTTESCECVKLALVLLSMLDTDDNDAVKDAVRTLALSDEFTLFAIHVAETWQDAEEEILRFGQQVHGWGRIHAVEHLEAKSGRVKDWLFHEGVHNTIGAAYSARTVADKIRLATVLTNPAFNDDDFVLASAILDGLLDESSMQGITAMPDRTQLLDGYLHQARRCRMSEQTLNTVLSVRDYLDQNIFQGSGKLHERAEEILHTDDIRRFVQELLAKGQGFRTACRMGIQCTDEMLHAMDTEFNAYADLVDVLPKDSDTLRKLLDIYRRHLPLAMMASGPRDQLGIGEAYRPYHQLSYLVQNLADSTGEGEDLVISALRCPVNANRQMALNVLESWCKDGYEPGDAMRAALQELLASEPCDDIRAQLEALKY